MILLEEQLQAIIHLITKKNISFGYIKSEYPITELVNQNIFIEIEKKKYPAIIETKPLKNKDFQLL